MRTLPALLVVLVGAAVAQQPTFDTAAIKVAVLASRPIFGNRGGPATVSRRHAFDLSINPDVARHWRQYYGCSAFCFRVSQSRKDGTR